MLRFKPLAGCSIQTSLCSGTFDLLAHLLQTGGDSTGARKKAAVLRAIIWDVGVQAGYCCSDSACRVAFREICQER